MCSATICKERSLYVKLSSFLFYVFDSNLVRPDSRSARQTASQEVLDALVLDIGNTSGTVFDFESSFTRVDFASSVFTVDILNTGDLGTVGTLTFRGTSTT
jgi:hypothetical protein